MMLLLDHCNNNKDAALQAAYQKSQDSVKAIVDSNNVLMKEKSTLSFNKIWQDSVNGRTIDSLKKTISILKSGYSKDTAMFKETIADLQSAFDNMDTAKARAAIDSLIIEARSANWSATNLFYQYDEMDSTWRLQKIYDDSVYHILYMIDSAKDGRFNALLSINNQEGKDYEAALQEIETLKKGKKFWVLVGAILGAATNFLHH